MALVKSIVQPLVRGVFIPVTGDGSSAPGGTLQVTTDVDTGTFYWVLTTSATAPSVAQVKAGQDHLGAAAPASGNKVVSATGVQSDSATGLAASTTYYPLFCAYQHC